jgi:hypothetical protein
VATRTSGDTTTASRPREQCSRAASGAIVWSAARRRFAAQSALQLFGLGRLGGVSATAAQLMSWQGPGRRGDRVAWSSGRSAHGSALHRGHLV